MQGPIESIIEEIVKDAGFALVAVDCNLKYKRMEVTIFNREGVNLADCESISKSIKESFEIIDILGNDYSLTVSSPGINRVLKTEREFKVFSGCNVELLYREDEQVRDKKGILIGRDGDKVVISEAGENFEVSWQDVVKLKLC